MRKNVGDARDLLPLMPAEFQIMLALANTERHGYGIMTEVRERTDGKVELGPGTLYGTIKRLVKQGLVVQSAARSDPTLNDERRKYYRLTGLGRKIASAEARRLAHLVNDARAKSLLPQST